MYWRICIIFVNKAKKKKIEENAYIVLTFKFKETMSRIVTDFEPPKFIFVSQKTLK